MAATRKTMLRERMGAGNGIRSAARGLVVASVPGERLKGAERPRLVFLAAVAAFLAAGNLPAHTPATSRFTYSRDVRPILERRCGSCHRAGGIGPMSLLDYREARPWAAAIRAAVLSGEMPPWPAEEGLPFEGQRILSGREIDAIVEWTRGGVPEGEPPPASGSPQLPGTRSTAPPFAAGSPREAPGEPEAIVRMTGSITLPAGERDLRREFRLPTGIKSDRWIAAWRFRPGNPAIVHDAVIHLRGMEGPPELLGTWTPGQETVSYPEGAARILAAGAELLLSLHYARGFQQRGEEMVDRSEIAFWFREAPPLERVRSRLLPERPPGAALDLATGGRLLSVAPLPMRGATAGPLVLEARLTGGEALLLLSGRKFLPHWPIAYRYASPLRLPPGTRILESGESREETWLEIAEPID